MRRTPVAAEPPEQWTEIKQDDLPLRAPAQRFPSPEIAVAYYAGLAMRHLEKSNPGLAKRCLEQIMTVYLVGEQ